MGSFRAILFAVALLGGCASEPLAPNTPWFTEITADVGVGFQHETGATGALHTPEIMGAGAALFDSDNDGDLDIYLTNGNHRLPGGTNAGGTVNRLFRQEADGRFSDQTDDSGLGDDGYGMGVAVGDLDNDGDPDVYVTNYGPDRLYRNRGDGTFEEITASAGVAVDGWSSSALFCDYDGDGYLDLFVTKYVDFNPVRNCSDPAGRPEYCGPEVFPPLSDVLLRNDGDGTFVDVSAEAGIGAVAAAGLGVVCDDFNDDGWPDVYVANDAYANNLWINQGDGTFADLALVMGVALNLYGQPEAGMGVVAASLDDDTSIDLFVTHLTNETNTYYANQGSRGGFSDVTGRSGLGAPSRSYTGFGTAAFDVELDGDVDLLIANGRVNRTEAPRDASVPPPWSFYAEPNHVFLNAGGGRFSLRHDPGFGNSVEITRALAVGDIDSDGDVDVLINNVHGPARLYRNDAPRAGHWLVIRAWDPTLQRDAIGARITVHGGQRPLVRTITRSFSYLSSSDARAHFGLGPVEAVDRIEVRWPDGLLERFESSGVDRVVELRRGSGEAL